MLSLYFRSSPDCGCANGRGYDNPKRIRNDAARHRFVPIRRSRQSQINPVLRRSQSSVVGRSSDSFRFRCLPDRAWRQWRMLSKPYPHSAESNITAAGLSGILTRFPFDSSPPQFCGGIRNRHLQRYDKYGYGESDTAKNVVPIYIIGTLRTLRSRTGEPAL